MPDASQTAAPSTVLERAEEPPIPWWVQFIFVAGVLGISALLVVRLVRVVTGPLDAVIAIAALLVAYVAADFVSGIFHWAFDRLGAVDTPVIGRAFIHPFRYHHVDPADMMTGDFITTNGKNSIAILPILVAAMFVPVAAGAWWGIAFLAGINAFAMGIWMTNQFHKWAHMPDPGAFIRGLQRAKLVLGPEHHSHHHNWPHECNYCITTGWCNPICERLGVFHRAERWLGRLGVPLAQG